VLESGEVVKHAAEGPNVDWVAVELVLDDFRGEIDRRAYSLRDEFCRILDNFAHAEVSNFNFPLLSKKNVLKLEISVNDSHLMQILDSICNRPKDAPQFKLRKRFFFIPSLFDYLREGIGTFEKSPRAAYYITI
jgi:hypothetical protein